MLKDKNKDIIRAVLPSCARKWARYKGRYIARARRRAMKEALNNIDPEGWDDSEVGRHIGHRLSRLRSDECWRISERRGADKLGPLKRWTKHHKRTSDNDEEAYEKICRVLEPGRNLITRHAVGHAENWLDLEKDQYRYSWRRRPQPPRLISSDRLAQIIETLFETAHGKLNKAFKQEGLRKTVCKKDDGCASWTTYTYTIYEWYDAASKKWVATSYFRYGSIQGLKRVRSVERRHDFHDWKACPNKLLIHSRDDLKDVVRALIPYGGLTEGAIKEAKPRTALYQVLLLARNRGLLPQHIENLIR